MIILTHEDIQPMIAEIDEQKKALSPKPLLFYPYLKRVLNEDRIAAEKDGTFKFPMEIKIPKDNKYLLQGDFEPEYVIKLDQPPMMDDGTPFWFNNSMNQCYLRYGYKNLDARKISDAKIDMEYIHSFLGGSSGHGKSVTINSMLGSLFHEYAPWELEVHMSDAKIVEFKKYGIKHRIPHIKSIAATEDADFVISVLTRCVREMNERGKIFGAVGASNLKNFRKATGLAMPRVLIVMDEVESTFRLAGKQAALIAGAIDDFARLGRAAGYHLYMATQNMSSDIPASAIGQIRNRCCLGSNEKTSNGVLANAGASNNFGRIGRLIVNTEVMNGGDTEPHNVQYQTPFINDEEFESEMKFLEDWGKKVGYRAKCAFYDEADMKTLATFEPIVTKAFTRMSGAGEITNAVKPIVLGYPAFVTDDQDELLKIWLDGKDIENIWVSSTIADRQTAHLKNVISCLKRNNYTVHLYSTDVDHKELFKEADLVVEARNAEAPPVVGAPSLVRKRMFLLQMDALAAQDQSYDRAKTEEKFKELGISREHWGNTLLCKRLLVFHSLINNGEWEDIKAIFPDFAPVYKELERSNSLITVLTPEKFAKVAFVIGDVAKILGFGRDPKSKPVNFLKKAMQDACRVGVLFVIFGRSADEMQSLNSAIRYVIFDNPDSRDWGRFRTEAPRELKSMLAVLYDNTDADNPQRKFKRTLLKEEF